MIRACFPLVFALIVPPLPPLSPVPSSSSGAFSARPAPLVSAQSRVSLAEVDIEGPLSEVVLDLGTAGSTRIVGELVAGESRRILVPLAPRSDADRITPTIRIRPEPMGLAPDLEPRGRARFLGWQNRASPLDALSIGLRERPRPAVAESSASLSRATPFALLAAAIVVLALRRRPVLALASSVVASAALVLVVHRPDAEASTAVVLVDGDVDSDRWRRVDAAFARIEVPADVGAFELWVEPAGAPVFWRVPLDWSWGGSSGGSSSGTGGTARAEVASPGARLFLVSTLPGGAALFSRERNQDAALDRAWLREEGTWTWRGPWPLSAALTAALPRAGPDTAPPSWLASGLPQGVAVLVGRVAGSGNTWMRIAGL
jgi:hypothetical protein